MPHEEAINIISDASGSQFDPYLAQALLKIQDEFKEITRNNSGLTFC
jgi:response regulator RpfG family c-di-GMP phosphodiesterase